MNGPTWGQVHGMPGLCHCDICSEPGPTDEPEDDMNTPDQEAVEQALAWFEQPMSMAETSRRKMRGESSILHGRTLSAAVRSLQHEAEVASSLYHTTREQLAFADGRADQAEADLAALKRRTEVLLVASERVSECEGWDRGSDCTGWSLLPYQSQFMQAIRAAKEGGQ